MKPTFRQQYCIIGCMLAVIYVCCADANQPPRFEFEAGQQGEIVLKLKEGSDTPVGSLIYTIRASDPDGDPLEFGLLGNSANELLVIESNHSTEANVYLKKLLDREVEDEYSLVLTLTDGKLGQGNWIQQSLLILVEDVNDNEPVFKPFSNTVFVQENALPADILTVEATDRDEGAYGQVVYSLQDDGEEIPFSISTVGGQGVLHSLQKLDYEHKSFYQFKILAKDRASEGKINTATAALLVRVVDVDDQGPEFIVVPSVTRIAEDATPGTVVMKVKAIDGDRGVNNAISYSLVNDSQAYFDINPNNGTVFVKQKLDRENQNGSNGAYILTIVATEDSKSWPKPFVSTETTILVLDVNDETPLFRSPLYMAEIDENSPVNLPVTFVGQSVPEVYDYDQGTNGTFHLSIDCMQPIFDIGPSVVVNEASFSIRVKNSTALDYEQRTEMECNITAQELATRDRRFSTVPISIRIRDVNDNIPQFLRSSYDVHIAENAVAGTSVARIEATDDDSGNYGTSSIRYTSLHGSIADKLQIDPVTGVLSVRVGGPNIFDRERISEFVIIVEAKDFFGKGNRNTVQLTIFLDDVNDNAPVFIQRYFEMSINENDFNFPYFYRVEAFDRDLNGSINSQLSYAIVSGDPQGNLTMNSTTGEIRVSRPLDFEVLPAAASNPYYHGLENVRLIDLTVQATDMGVPPLSTNVSVRLYVHDVNDFSPTFSNSSYSQTIPEDTPAGTFILQVKALDFDGSSPNNVVAYRIQNGALDKFVIDSASGVISVANGASLDPDRTKPRIDQYTLDILALDGGLGASQLHASSVVTITISDVNNKPPVLANPGTIHVKENVAVGFHLTQLYAFDPDEKPRMRYWIDFTASEGRDESGIVIHGFEYDVTSCFEIDESNGIIRVSRQLDREKAETVRLSVRVEDLAAATPDQTASGTLTVIIEDVNDNDPVFTQSFYRRSLPENSKRGTHILRLIAEDADKDRSLTYSLDGPIELLELVHLDSETGEIVVAGKIDRERYAWINLTARAFDGGSPNKTGSAPVFIQILDENDNNPQFLTISTSWSVRENTPLGTVIGNVQAHDPDFGDSGHITYLIDRRSSKGMFSVDPEKGSIIVSGTLDREEQQAYTLIVEAWDNYKYGYAAGESRNAFQQVTIIVSDENDQVPVFEPFTGCATVTEFHDPRFHITTVHASDKDDANTLNGKIMFSIESGNERGLFGMVNMDFVSAKLYALKPLVGFHGNYTLKIRAQDKGMPSNSAFQDISVCVTDFNDHAPKFVRPEQNTTIKIAENATVGTFITKVVAFDEDAGLNSEIRYSLRNDPLGHWNTFHMNELTGVVVLAQPLDREKQKLYEIRIEARDLGVPTSLSSDLDLFILVHNVNDFQPQFKSSIFQVNFTEHQMVGSQFIQLPETIDLDEPDDPSTPEDPVCYFIVGGNELSIFIVNPIHHSLMVAKELDREKQAVHTLLVKATDNCDQQPSAIDIFEGADNTVLKVVIGVIDINDNRPLFAKEVFTGGLTTEADFGTEILRIQAFDQDSEKNLSYYISRQIQATLADGMDLIGSNPFVIDQETGSIRLNFDPQRQMKGYFDMEVFVNDSGGLYDTARVFIYLLREDQRVKFVLRQHPQILRPKIDLFREVVGNITKLIVNVDEFKLHSNEDGIVDKTRTDVFMHFVNPDDNSILEVDTVLRLIDANIESLDEIFKEFNVLDTSPAEAVKESHDPRPLSLFWASGTAIFLAVILLLVIGLCISQRMVLMRKLKAASATAFGSHESSLNGTSSRVPNTNQHTVEGSNPIWRRELDPDWFKQEDIYRHNEHDALDSLDVNAILGDGGHSTPRDASDTNTASLRSAPESFQRALISRHSARASTMERPFSIKSEPVHDVTMSEKECEFGEVRDEDSGAGLGTTYQRNVYHFGYPVFQDKPGISFVPRKLETTEL